MSCIIARLTCTELHFRTPAGGPKLEGMNVTPLRRIPYADLDDLSPAGFERWGKDTLPGHLGIEIERADPDRIVCRVPVRRAIMAPHGYLHGGSAVAIADTLCGYGCILNLPEGALGFTTIELKTNFLGTARGGFIRGEGRPIHRGKTTQVWDATLYAGTKVIATFRCTQMILFQRP